ncbi:PilC/PilY family type IV pilus protein [Oleiagrimonas sp. C23AA]|uniref:pilus assembly protein n=1 Tax=Oleiagrimonas sp. C23AA TaxID=2719047 RepID=UPI001423E972|nr:PilC/PilY family type IV pilus protein [Oleiagrimonas sp. C23AA]NII09164.1 hypothetical protein [Oleiagrimonas sp. C23AA]
MRIAGFSLKMAGLWLLATTVAGMPAMARAATEAAPAGNTIALNSQGKIAQASDYTAFPVLNVGAVPPLVMLVMSRDEQLFIKAYSDFTDLDGDGKIDTTYNDSFSYSGYFDPHLCYSYAGGQFKADNNAGGTNQHACSNEWSGNFLNWVAMSRMDMVRYVLYGGYRHDADGTGDTPNKTVLERANIPSDLHAWAKVYSGSDVADYTPFSYDKDNPVSFCNVSEGSDRTNDPPELRVARGNWSEWASTAVRQCDWKSAASGGNDGSYNDVPSETDNGLGSKEYTVRVQVCDAKSDYRESFCQKYGNGDHVDYKPVGLLQRYGESGQMRFGLLTGSFSEPRSGGVLRRNIGKIAGNGPPEDGCTTGDEIDLTDGTFCNEGAGDEGIINTLNRIQLTQWDFVSRWKDCNTYGILNRRTSNNSSNKHLDDPGKQGANSYQCRAWGNPLTEMYAEALRYIANDQTGPDPAFNHSNNGNNGNNGDAELGLSTPAWKDPYRSPDKGGNPYCAACSIIVLSTGLNSFDSDEIPSFHNDLSSIDAAAATKTVGQDEGISGNYLVGRVVSSQSELDVGNPVNTYEDLCTSKEVTDLSLVRGICPDIPSMEGSYLMAGLAYDAHTMDMRPGLLTQGGKNRPKACDQNGQNCETYKNTVTTYTVALAENLPKFQIPVSGGDVTLAPLCQSNNDGSATADSGGWRSCYLGAVGVGPKTSRLDSNYVYGRNLQTDASGNYVAGSFSLVWEDSLWGNDHDQDVVNMITYCVGDTCKRSTALPMPVSSGNVCFYYDSNYGGRNWCPSTGTTPHNFPSNDAFRDQISSLKIPSGYSVTLYKGENQTGESKTFTGNTPYVGNDFNDQARSYTITPNNTYSGYDICWRSDSSVCGSDGKPDVGSDTVLIRIETLSAYAGNAMLTGYAVSGSDNDGVKRIALRPGNQNGSVLSSSNEPPSSWEKPQVLEFHLNTGTPAAKQLQNPLYYAAKYGGFDHERDTSGQPIDQPCDSTTTPSCTTSNWDSVNNNTGAAGSDGVPDNFFPVRNPAQLGQRLSAVFNDILSRSGSGTSAAVVANSADGAGLTYQALYQSEQQSTDGGQTVKWTGDLNALWTDSYGYLREDANHNNQLDDYHTDPVIEFFHDDTSGRTKVNVYTMPANSDGTPVRLFDKTQATKTEIALSQLQPVWSAASGLDEKGMDTTDQRSYTTGYATLDDASRKRYIFTWLDKNLDGKVDPGEQVPFTWNSFNTTLSVNGAADAYAYHLLNTDSTAGAQNLINWVRGTQITQSDGTPSALWRSRALDGKVMRLGDIVDSTPVVVGTPAEAYDLLYNDASYGVFRKQYRSRRQVIYVGANDGMLHAFNGGFYNASLSKLQLQPNKVDGSIDTSYTKRALGAELWAYVPGNLLAHLRWMANPDYEHNFYVDGSPIAQDVKVFQGDADHPGGWGTILIAPFRFGGGPIATPLLPNSEYEKYSFYNTFSAYAVLDITNPEKAPTLLAELTNTKLTTDSDDQCISSSTVTRTLSVTCAQLKNVVATYTSSVPAQATFLDTHDGDPTDFYLFTGSGTTDNGGTGTEGGRAVSSQDMTIRAYDIAELADNKTDPVRTFNFADVGSNHAGSDSFAGDLLAVDFDLDGLSEGVYFGSVKDNGSANAFGGNLFKVSFIGDKVPVDDPSQWTAQEVTSDLDRPVVAHVTVGLNDRGKPMIFDGTGRAFTKADLSDTHDQFIFGVMDTSLLKNTDAQYAALPLSMSDLADVTDVSVYDDGSVSGAGSDNTYQALTDSYNTADKLGWYLDLQNYPLKADGSEDTSQGKIPSERVVSSQTLLGGILLTTTFMPGTDACTDVGSARLYGQNYKTGTADPSLAYFGTTSKNGKNEVNRSTSLGAGLPSSPSLVVTSGAGKDKSLRACVQTSTGAIICKDITTLKSVTSGEVSWRQPLDQ